MLATVTSCVHAVILALGRESALADMPYLLSFEWPSVVYVLDVLAWDVFFGFFAVCLGASFERGGLGGWLRWVLIASGVLAFAGLWGAVIGDMRFRNIGILGYVAGFTVAAAGLAVHFRRCLRRAARGLRWSATTKNPARRRGFPKIPLPEKLSPGGL